MTEHISTEEAERIAFAIQGRAMEVTGAGELVYDEELRDAASALRSLAAERDALRDENGRLRGRGIGIADEAFAQGFKRGYAAALGENQP